MEKANKNTIDFKYVKLESVDPPITKIDRRGNFVRYDEDNLYPQFLASLTLQSPTHSAFIELIGKSIAGLGVEMLKPDGTPWVEAQAWFDSWNEFDIDDTQVEKMASDLAKYNGVSLSAEWNKAKLLTDTAQITGATIPNETILNQGAEFSYTPFKDWRSGVPDADEDVHEYFYSKEWHKSNPEYKNIGSFNPNTVVYEDDKGAIIEDESQLLYYFKKNDNSDVYPIPEYMASIYQILSEGILSKTNYNSIINAFQPDGILVVPYLEDSEKGKQKLESDFRNNYTGAENARKVIVMQTDGGVDSQQPVWIPINSTDNPEMRVALASQFSQDISMAHGSTSPALVGQKGTTGFSSDAMELVIAYNLFFMKSIEHRQRTIERILKRFVIRYGAKQFRTAIPKVTPLKFKELLGVFEETLPTAE